METAITPTKSLIAAGFFAATLALVLLALFWMRDLFNRYRRGEILTAACATAILRIGQVLFAQALWAILMPTLLVLALTADNPAGHKILQIGLSSESLGLILTAALFITIGAVMHEAARIAEENAGFI